MSRDELREQLQVVCDEYEAAWRLFREEGGTPPIVEAARELLDSLDDEAGRNGSCRLCAAGLPKTDDGEHHKTHPADPYTNPVEPCGGS